MPRHPGQIDERKRTAILQAAADLFTEKGASVSMAEIARRAGVSKQTLYNRFPTKLDIGRALAAANSDAITAPLRSPAKLEDVLTAIAEALLNKIREEEGKVASLRGLSLISPESPDLAHAIYDAGPGESVRRIASWLADQQRLGHMSIPDPMVAAEMFAGMTLGHGHLRSILALKQPTITDIPAHAREIARRFIRAFSTD